MGTRVRVRSPRKGAAVERFSFIGKQSLASEDGAEIIPHERERLRSRNT